MIPNANSPEARRQAAAVLGSASTERKAAAARENGKKGGSKPGERAGMTRTEETRALMSQAARAGWEKRRATSAGRRTGPAPKPLSEFPCTCGGGAGTRREDHKSTCPRGAAIRRREKASAAK